MIRPGDTVGFVSCSDGLCLERKKELEETIWTVKKLGMHVVESPYLYQKGNLAGAGAKERAAVLMEMYQDPKMRAIFDVSGGNLANQVLGELSYEKIAESEIEFWGYSDLTVVLNAIYTKTGKNSWLYQIRNLAGREKREQEKRLDQYLMADTEEEKIRSLFPRAWTFLQGKEMEGVIVGGNIRCLLKLAGTEYLPDFSGKLLFLESCGGEEGVISSLLTQLEMMGVYEKISGLLLGTFTQLDREKGTGKVEEIVREALRGHTLPVARTMQVGHGRDSWAIPVGRYVKIYEKEKEIKINFMKNHKE